MTRQRFRTVFITVAVSALATASVATTAAATGSTEPSPPGATTPTLGERGAVLADFTWTEAELTIDFRQAGVDDPELTLTCNDVASSPDDPTTVVLPPAAVLDVTCEVSTGLSFTATLPGVERDGPSLVDSTAARDLLDLCGPRMNRASNATELFVNDLVGIRCSAGVLNVAYSPADVDFPYDAGTLDIIVCPTVRGVSCPALPDQG